MDYISQMTDYLMTQPKLETPTKPVSGGEKDFQTLVAEKQAQQAGSKPAKGQEAAGEEAKAPAQEGQGDQESQDGMSPEEQMAMAAMAAAQLNIVTPNQDQTAPVEQQVAPAAVQMVTAQESKGGQQPQVQQPQQEQAAQTPAEEPMATKAAPVNTMSQEETASNDRQPSQPDLTATKQPVEKQTEATVTESDAQPTEKPLFRDVEAAPVKVSNSAEVDTPETETSVRNQVMDSLAKAAESGESRVKISLHPESLGTVTVELVRKDDGALHVMLHADNLRTQSILEKNSGNLQYLLADRSDSAVQVQVERQPQGQESRQDLYDQERQNQQQQQQQHQSRQQQEESDFFQQLRLGLIPVGEEEVS